MTVERLIYKVRWYFLVLLGFCFLFAFRVPVVGNAAYLAIVALFLLLFTSNAALNTYFNLLKDKVFVAIVVFYLAIISLSMFVTVASNAFDFSFVIPLLNSFVSLFACAAVAVLIYCFHKRHNIIDFLVWLLMAQVTIIFLMLLLPDLREAIQAVVRTDHEMDRMEGYHGIRGLGLSGSVAFGLAVTMGALGFTLHYWFANYRNNQSTIVTFMIFMVCLFASLSTGRTAVLGFFVGFMLYFFSHQIGTMVIRAWKHFFIGAMLATALVVYVMNNDALLEIAYLYSRYVFQFVWRYLETGQATVTSLEVLDNMYFVPPKENWWFGDGYYFNSDGSHYMRTDAGYMRFMLYFGFVGSLLMYAAFLFTATMFALRCSSVMPSSKVFFALLTLIAFVFHYKGDVIFYSVPFMKVFFMIGLYYLVASRSQKDTFLTAKPLVADLA